MSTFLTGVPNPNTRPPKPKLKEQLEAMVQQRRDDIKIKIPAFVDNLPSTDFHPILGDAISIAQAFGHKPSMRKPNRGTKFIIGATIEK